MATVRVTANFDVFNFVNFDVQVQAPEGCD